MQLDQGFDQSQAQARPAALTADEAVEDVGLDVEGNAPAGVADLQADLAHALLGREGDDAVRRGLAKGVLGEVIQSLAEPGHVGADQADGRIDDQLDLHPAGPGLVIPAGGAVGHHLRHVDIGDIEGHFTGVDLGHVEDIVDRAGQLGGG